MSKKDYKQGAADAMAAYEAFGEKQETAIRHIGNQVEEVKSSIGGLNQNIQNISDYITDKEKAELYKLNTPVDIADLDDAEKRILLAVLYQLSTDDPEHTPQQENYVRAVQKYLEIHNPQTQIDLESVENIEDNKTGKPYALYHFEAVGRLSPEEAASAKAYAQQFMEIVNTEEVLPEVG